MLRLDRTDKPYVLDVLRRIVPLLSTEVLEGRLWIVERDRIRVRGEPA